MIMTTLGQRRLENARFLSAVGSSAITTKPPHGQTVTLQRRQVEEVILTVAF